MTQAAELIRQHWPEHDQCLDAYGDEQARAYDDDGIVCACGKTLGWPDEEGVTHPDLAETANDGPPYAVGDMVTVAGMDFTKHSDSPFPEHNAPDGGGVYEDPAVRRAIRESGMTTVDLPDPPWNTAREVDGVVPPEQDQTDPDDRAAQSAEDAMSDESQPHVYTVCPGCGFSAATPNEWDRHVESTGHGPTAEQRQAAGEPVDIAALAEGDGYEADRSKAVARYTSTELDTPVVPADPINAALQAIDPTRPYTPTDVELQLVDIERRLEAGQVFQRVWEERLYQSSIAFEFAWARAIDASSGSSADKRNAEATLACEEKLIDKMLAEHMVKAVRETMHNLRAMLSGFQSIARSVGASMSVAGVGRP